MTGQHAYPADPASAHDDPDGGIRWDLDTGRVVRAEPVISVRYYTLWHLLDATRTNRLDRGDPAVTMNSIWARSPTVTSWRFVDRELIYRIVEFNEERDCYLLAWPD